MGKLYITEDDTSPKVSTTLKKADGTTPKLDGATVEFSVMRPRGAGNLFTKQASIKNASQGVVVYNWDTEDTSEPGRYRCEFKVTYSDETVEHFPNSGFDTLIINQNAEA